MFYKKFGILVSIIIISLQIITVSNVKWGHNDVSPILLIYFIIAYLMTDLINGFVHMYMDNNTNYTSFIGPLIAAFHLHHKQPKYKDRHFLLVYFFETGSKNWLIAYLLTLAYIQSHFILPFAYNFIFVSFGILSSFAEVSHYLCHNSQNRFVRILQKYHILLSPKHHALHHSRDNYNYAFLNGFTDPLLNLIAKYMVDGYKNNADLHCRNYTGLQTDNRL